MRRQHSPKSFGIVAAILIGVLAGIVFYLRDAPSTPTPPTLIASQVHPVVTAVPPTAAAMVNTVTPPPRFDLFIPEVLISSTIMQLPFDPENGTWDLRFIGRNAGHLQRTAWFDEPGNIVIVGHVEMADGSAGPFAALAQVSPGLFIYILNENHEVVRTYQVEETRITTPNDLSVLYATADERLTLITCNGYDFVSDTYQQRVVTVALRVA